MKLLAIAFLLAATYNVYAISNVTRIGANQYQGIYVNTNPARKADFPAGVTTKVIVDTKGCTHVPGKDQSALIITGSDLDEIQFSDGGTCDIVSLTTVNTK